MQTNGADLLAGLSPLDAAGVLALGTPFALAAGATLFGLGASADSLYLIRRGRVVLTLPMHIGNHEQDVLIEERVPGQTVGWSALIPPHRFTLTATAPLPTELTAFRRDALLEYCQQHPEVGYAVGMNVAAVVGQRLQVFQAMWLREMQRLVNHARA
jgi:CRP-like cAMP-binding protein